MALLGGSLVEATDDVHAKAYEVAETGSAVERNSDELNKVDIYILATATAHGFSLLTRDDRMQQAARILSVHCLDLADVMSLLERKGLSMPGVVGAFRRMEDAGRIPSHICTQIRQTLHLPLN